MNVDLVDNEFDPYPAKMYIILPLSE